MPKVVVLDASAFLAGFDPCSIKEPAYATPTVLEELPKGGPIAARVRVLQESGKLTVKEPTRKAMGRVDEAATKVGDKITLSKADLQLLALALDLKEEGFEPVILTDDYSIQNVAHSLKIRFSPLTTLGISKALDWIVYCPACFKEYPLNGGAELCGICGTKLKRKAVRKRKL